VGYGPHLPSSEALAPALKQWSYGVGFPVDP
jgi:hypothetical protein